MRKLRQVLFRLPQVSVLMAIILILSLIGLSACIPADARQTAISPATPFTNIAVISPTRQYEGTASPTTKSGPSVSPSANAIIPSPGSTGAPGVSNKTPSPSPSTGASPAPSGSPSASPQASGTGTATPSAPSTGAATTIDLTAQNLAFDKNSITVKAGAQITINFNNKDSGIPHNFAVYTNSSASQSIFVGQIITGPGNTTYKFTAPAQPGTYFFRCDVHPTQMTGSFIVQ